MEKKDDKKDKSVKVKQPMQSIYEILEMGVEVKPPPIPKEKSNVIYADFINKTWRR